MGSGKLGLKEFYTFSWTKIQKYQVRAYEGRAAGMVGLCRDVEGQLLGRGLYLRWSSEWVHTGRGKLSGILPALAVDWKRVI